MSHIIKKSGLKNTLFIPEEVFRNKPENDVREIVRKELADGTLLIRETKKLIQLLIHYKRINKATGYRLLYELVNADILNQQVI